MASVPGVRSLRFLLLAFALLPSLHITVADVSGSCELGDRSPSPWASRRGSVCDMLLSVVRAEVEVVGMLAQVTVNHTYTNDEARVIEDAVLSFTLPSKAILLGTAASVADRRQLRGEVRARETGADELPRVCTRSTAGVPGMFRLPLGKLQPSDTVVLQMEYAQPLTVKLDVEGNASMQVVLHVPSGSHLRSSYASKSRLGSKAAAGEGTTPSPLVIDVRWHEPLRSGVAAGPAGPPPPGRRAELRSPTPGVTVERPGHAAPAAAAARLSSARLQDVTIEASVAPPAAGLEEEEELAPELVIQRHPQTGLLAAAVMLPPLLPRPSGGRGGAAAAASSALGAYEVLLLLSRSASMHGARFGRVRSALQTFARSLPAGLRVNLLGLGGDAAVPAFRGRSAELDEESFKILTQEIKGSDAAEAGGAGGAGAGPGARERAGRLAEQVVPLKRLLGVAFEDLERPEGAQLRVIVITDQHPRDSDQAIEYIRERCSLDCRLSTIGLGWSASSTFIEGAARAGGGSASFVAEHGGAAALERSLVQQLAEALQPAVHGVEVDWAALRPAAPDTPGSPGLFTRLGEQDRSKASQEEDDADLASFTAGGGLRDLQPIPAEPPAVGSGGRILAMAFLGDSAAHLSDGLALSLKVTATVAGQRRSAEVPISAKPWHNGTALHAWCAAKLLEALASDPTGDRLPSSDDRDWQAKALSVAYSLQTADTQWVVRKEESIDVLANAEQCSSRPTMSGTEIGSDRQAFTSESGSGRSSSSAGSDRATAAAGGVSTRRPPPPTQGLSLLPQLTQSKELFSLLECVTLGSALALRALPCKPSRAGGASSGAHLGFGGLHDMYFGSTLALRGFRPFGAQMRPPPGDPTRLGPSLTVGPRVKAPSDSLSLRSLGRVGASFSCLGGARAAERLTSQLSVLDFARVGSSLALRALPREKQVRGRPYGNWMSSYSMLDLLFLGSSLSISSCGSGSRSASLLAASRFRNLHDWYGLGDGLDEEYYGHGRGYQGSSGPPRVESLSLRCTPRVGSSLSLLASGRSLDASSLSSRLSVLDFADLGATLALRRPGPLPLRRAAESLSLSGPRPGAAGWRPPGDQAAPTYEYDSLLADADLGFGFPARDPAASPRRSAPEDRGAPPANGRGAAEPPARPLWLGVGVAGGLIAPVLPLVRSAGLCTAEHESVRLTWWRAASQASAALYVSTGPLAPSRGGAALHVGTVSLPAPSSGKKGKGEKKARAGGGEELVVAVRISRGCEVTVHGAAEGGRQAGGGGAALLRAQLPEASAVEAAAAADGPEHAAALRAALAARRAVHSAERAAAEEKASGSPELLDADVVKSAESTIDNYWGVTLVDDDAETTKYHEMIAAQSFNGSFNFSAGAAAVGLNEQHLELLGAAWTSEDAEGAAGAELGQQAANTAAALAALSTRHQGKRKGWVMLAAKAEAWLADGVAAAVGCGTVAECVAAAELSVVRWTKAPPQRRSFR